MSDTRPNKTGTYLKYTMIGLAVILLILAILLGRSYVYLHRMQLINARKLQLSALINNNHPLTASDVTLISPWMTFRYINHLFNLPPSYLQTSLSISDPSYPQISLSGYANHQRMSSALLITQVESSLYTYLTTASSTN